MASKRIVISEYKIRSRSNDLRNKRSNTPDELKNQRIFDRRDNYKQEESDTTVMQVLVFDKD